MISAFAYAEHDTELQLHLHISRTSKGTNQEVTQKVGLAVCEAMVAYSSGDFATTIQLLLPLKYDLVAIGGSDAQVGIIA